MTKRTFCMLAEDLDGQLAKFRWMSEKLDGMRAIYDGGASSGLPKSSVPYANTRNRPDQICTGLFSRYGNVIAAPRSFLKALPSGIILDMELWLGRGMFEIVMSYVKKLFPVQSEWDQVQARVLDTVPPELWLAPGEIRERNFQKVIGDDALAWWKARSKPAVNISPTTTFRSRYSWLRRQDLGAQASVVEQVEVTSEQQFADAYARLLSEGAEGAMLKSPMLYYECRRTQALLKAKPTKHGTGIVVGWKWGALADNRFALVGDSQGTWLGAMGAAQVVWNNRLFELGGFTLKERQMVYKGTQTCAADEGLLNPGQDCDTAKVESLLFPLGSQISFAYIELTAAGIPRSARYERNTSTTDEE